MNWPRAAQGQLARPAHQIWTRSKLAWTDELAQIPGFEKQRPG